MNKKERRNQNFLSVICPNCRTEIRTRNKNPRCFHCGAPLKVVKVNPEIIVRERRRKKIVVYL